MTHLFTSESVTEGHPDKVCDQISDAILDAVLQQDPTARVAVETLATKGLVHVAGELTCSSYVEIPDIVRAELSRIGYDSKEACFDADSCGVTVSLGQQSPDIAGGVNRSLEARRGSSDPRDSLGAGDQGLVFGFATDETPDLMPAPIWLAHDLSRRLSDLRRSDLGAGLLPDGKTQVTLSYDGDRPLGVDTIVVSSQHRESVGQDDLAHLLQSQLIDPALKQAHDVLGLQTGAVRTLVNPSGRFVIGGPAGDTGLTGRKIIVDTYGGAAPHGGGAFSGKDPSKVDRSGAYAARWVAKNIVAAGLARRCLVQIAYAIGSAHPVSVFVDTQGTGVVPDHELSRIVQSTFDLRPGAIIEDLGLLSPSLSYRETASLGHFGRSGFPWEDTGRVGELLAA